MLRRLEIEKKSAPVLSVVRQLWIPSVSFLWDVSARRKPPLRKREQNIFEDLTNGASFRRKRTRYLPEENIRSLKKYLISPSSLLNPEGYKKKSALGRKKCIFFEPRQIKGVLCLYVSSISILTAF